MKIIEFKFFCMVLIVNKKNYNGVCLPDKRAVSYDQS